MNSFCTECGTKLEKGAVVCTACGKETGVKPMSAKKKLLRLVISAAAILLIAVCALTAVINNTGSKGLAGKVVKAYKDYDIDLLVDNASEIYFLDGDGYAENYFKMILKADLDLLEEEAGHSYKLTAKITDTHSLSKHKFESLLESLESYEDFDEELISEVRIVELELCAKGKKHTETIEKELYLSKEDGTWRVLFIK